jgi:hypothetical protein
MIGTDGPSGPIADAPNEPPKPISRRAFLAGVSAAAIIAPLPALAGPNDWHVVYIPQKIDWVAELMRPVDTSGWSEEELEAVSRVRGQLFEWRGIDFILD